MEYSCVIVAAGKGRRSGLEYNKVFYEFEGKSVIERSCEVFIDDDECHEIVIVVSENEEDEFRKRLNSSKIKYAYGGKERNDSVYNGLELVTSEYVMIHDGARCFISKEEIEKIKVCLEGEDACLLMVPVTDTIKRVIDGYVETTFIRSELMAAQTPQAFKTDLIRKCHQLSKDSDMQISDDAMLVEAFSDTKVKAVFGSYHNIKITTPNDLK